MRNLPIGKIPNHLLKNLLTSLPADSDDLIIPPSVGIDAAGVRIGNRLFAVTTDPITFTSKSVGKYAVRVNINDIACLGCRPLWFSSVILLPENTRSSYLYDLWHELNEELKTYGIQSIGGHTEVTSSVNEPVVVGQLIGESVGSEFFDSRHIQPGDKILLWRGAAVEGTALLAAERFSELSKHILPAQLETMKDLIDNPGICIWPAAEKLFKLDGLVALHDPTEGGVATALHELADAADCGLEVDAEKIPVLSETLQLANILKFNPLGLLASGSLLVVCKNGVEETIIEKLQGERVALIGEFTEGNERQLTTKEGVVDLPRFDQDEIVKALKVEIDA